jgi:hypothetical protein
MNNAYVYLCSDYIHSHCQVTEAIKNLFNPLMPELYPSAQHSLLRFFTGDFNF